MAALDLADDWLNLRRIELEVYVDNTPAVRLYERHGFAIEGTLRDYAFRGGGYVDAYAMARLRGWARRAGSRLRGAHASARLAETVGRDTRRGAHCRRRPGSWSTTDAEAVCRPGAPDRLLPDRVPHDFAGSADPDRFGRPGLGPGGDGGHHLVQGGALRR